MSIQKKLLTLCFATVFTLGLAACGGGGGGGSDAPPASGMMDDDVSLEGKYIPSGTMIPVEDVPNIVITVDSGESETLAGLGTVECASDEDCSGTVVDGVLTITGDLKIVSVDPALDSETATVLAGLVVDMLPDAPDPAVVTAGWRSVPPSPRPDDWPWTKVADDSTDGCRLKPLRTRSRPPMQPLLRAGDILASEAAVERGKVAELQTSLVDAKASRMVKMRCRCSAHRASGGDQLWPSKRQEPPSAW